MSKRTISTLIFFLAHFYFYGQDLIVTDKGDSLNARIVRTTLKSIYFFLPESEKVIKWDASSFRLYNKNYYPYSSSFPDVKLGLTAGFSYRTIDIKDENRPEIKNYKKELKTGYHFSGELLFFTKRNVALGVTYSMFKTQHQSDTIRYITGNGQSVSGIMKDDISISFIGATIGKKIYLDYNIFTTFLTSVGFLNYSNAAIYMEEYFITGRTIGVSFGLMVDYQMTKYMAIGGGLSATAGTLSNVHINDTSGVIIPGGESISRIDLSGGIKWYIK